MDEPLQSIPEFFAGKTVAVTGATGFVGQCLIEKLLRSCPEIKKIFVFIRPKRNEDSCTRLEKLTCLPLFDRVRLEQKDFFKKLVAIPSDFEKPNLALDEESKKLICDEVDIFFHSAATLKFNEALRLAFEVNTLGVRSVINLCKKIKNLQVLCHISTAYSFCNKHTVGEVIYDIEQDYNKLEDSLKWMNDDIIEKITPEILKDRPNTYTLTKAFGEEVLVREAHNLPVCIIRPSIVGATYEEPLQGWCSNLNGATGLFAACGKGLLRTIYGDKHNSVDVIPSDFVVNGVIAATWKTGLSILPQIVCSDDDSDDDDRTKSCRVLSLEEIKMRRRSIPIYHFVVGQTNPIRIEKWCQVMTNSFIDYPLNDAVLIPVLNVTSNKFLYQILTFVMEYLPAFVFDLGLTFLGRKPMLKKMNHKIAVNVKVLQYFISNQWTWDDSSSVKLLKEMSPMDRKNFNFDAQRIVWQKYMNRYAIGMKKYLLKEDLQRYPAERRHMQRLRVLGFVGQGIIFLLVWRLIVSRTNIARNLWRLFMSFVFKFLHFFQISSTLHKSSFFQKLQKSLLL